MVMGSSERPEQVVDAEACARLGVDVVKRSTGGGSVLQTGDVLNYSLVTPAPGNLDLKAGFRQGMDLVCAILAAFGIVGGRKELPTWRWATERSPVTHRPGDGRRFWSTARYFSISTTTSPTQY